MSNLIALASGLIFGLGLIAAGMTQPAKVKGFLDLAGAWDPSLALVMGGAIAVGIFAFARARRQARAWSGEAMELPSSQVIDARLIVGGVLFGVGWGLGGFCPGPGLVAGTTAGADALAFVGAMALASYVTARLDRR